VGCEIRPTTENKREINRVLINCRMKSLGIQPGFRYGLRSFAVRHPYVHCPIAYLVIGARSNTLHRTAATILFPPCGEITRSSELPV
jgi:hypothetical protein